MKNTNRLNSVLWNVITTNYSSFKKRIYLLVALFALRAAVSFGQITITQTDMPQPGDTIRLSTCNTNVGLPNPSLTGANYIWNYDSLIPYTQTIDTFINVSATPLAYQLYFNDALLYPAYKSTVAQNAPNLPALGPVTITNVINYYKNQASSYESVGYGANINGIPTSVKDDTIDIMYVLPMNYGNSDSCHSASHAQIAGIGYYATHQKRINNIDGWGTLKTPFGVFNTLRVKTILYSYDSVEVDTPIHIGFSTPLTEKIQYKWFGNGFGLPLLQVNEQVITGNPVFTSAVYRDSIRKQVLGLSPVNSFSANILLYPNPNNGEFTFQSPATVTGLKLDIYNMLGQRIYEQKADIKFPLVVNLNAPPAGLYFYKFVSETGKVVAEGKIMVE